MKLPVCEIFHSIQGESSYAGYPCVFIRTSGCNLNCTYCDTPYAKDVNPDDYHEIKDILDKVARYKNHLVEITGGEPLLYPQTVILADYLIIHGYTVLIETNGSLDISALPDETVVILDIKCPSSGMSNRNCWKNLETLRRKDEIKFVMANFEDFLFAEDIVRRMNIRAGKIHYSPVLKVLPPARLAEWMLKARSFARLHLQLHKYIWNENHVEGEGGNRN